MTLRLFAAFSLALSLACAAGGTDDDEGTEGTGSTGSTEGSEGTEAGDCSDEADNDADGDFDCEDDGCAGSPACEESDADTDADTDSDTDTDVRFDLVDFNGDYSFDPAVFTMTTSHEASNLEIWVAETADTTSSYPWEEAHEGFVPTSGGGPRTYELRLDWVTSFEDQRDDHSTLLNPAVLGEGGLDRLTWLFMVERADGEFDCVVTGHDPAYYATHCTNVE